MEFSYLPNNAQPQAAPPSSAGFIGPVKAIEEPWEVSWGNPCPVVFHG